MNLHLRISNVPRFEPATRMAERGTCAADKPSKAAMEDSSKKAFYF